MEAEFILSKKVAINQYNQLKKLGVNVSYSYKTNNEVGKVLQEETDSEFSIHAISEIDEIDDKEKIWYFMQANNKEEIDFLLGQGIKKFVIDNEIDLENLLSQIKGSNKKIDLLIRMKFREHTITSGKYFIYGLPSKKVNEIISEIKNNSNINKIGVHIHRKSQNASEWEIKEELIDSLSKKTLSAISVINLGGGLPIKYKTYTSNINDYIFNKIEEVVDWFEGEVYLEPGRFIAGPSVKLKTNIIQIQENTIVLNTSIYNGILDAHITDIRLLVEGEASDESTNAETYKIKGNTPTRDDIFRYDVKLIKPRVGDEIIFLNAGAYNYTTNFCSLKPLKTTVLDDFMEVSEEKSCLRIVAVPTSQGSLKKNIGTKDAPKKILDSLGIDYDVCEIDRDDFVQTTKNIESQEGDIFIGGDHSITYSLFKSGKAKSLVVFDAHADCVNNFSPPTHEDYLRTLVEEGHINPKNILIIGLRNVDSIEKKYLEQKNIKHIYFKDIDKEILKEIRDFVDKQESIYLSIDIDALDGEKYFATGYPEKEGFSLEELQGLLMQILESKKVMRQDLVEFNPELDNGDTFFAAKSILKTLLKNPLFSPKASNK